MEEEPNSSSQFKSQSTSTSTSQESTQACTSKTTKESCANPTPIFRPINFDKAEEDHTPESGSDCAIDSAYSSDNIQSSASSSSTVICSNPLNRKITATLQNKSLWKTFKKIGNEMIVTKPGR